MNVLVIPEDHTKDQYILKPLVEAMFGKIGLKAKAIVCQDPRLRGYEDATNVEKLQKIIDRYGYKCSVFLLCVDRDGDENRRERLTQLEEFLKPNLKGRDFFSENAWQETEVWILAGMVDLPPDWGWREIRLEKDSKEKYFEPYAEKRGLNRALAGGRKLLAEEAASNYSRIRSLCPEDIGELEKRVAGLAKSS